MLFNRRCENLAIASRDVLTRWQNMKFDKHQIEKLSMKKCHGGAWKMQRSLDLNGGSK